MDEIDRVDKKKNEIDRRHDGLDHEHETSANGVSIERNSRLASPWLAEEDSADH